MPRLQFELAPRYPFSTELQIYVSHVNQGGHLDNAQLLTLVSEARARFFKWVGYGEFDMKDYSLLAGDIGAQYKSEGFHGETMVVQVAPADFNKYGLDLMFLMTEKTSGREVARGKTGMVLVHRETGKPAPLPAEFRSRLETL